MPDLVTTRIFTDGEKGITAAKLNDIVASSTIQTSFVGTKPVASTVDPADNLLVLKSSGQYAQATFQKIVDSVNAQLPSNDSEIWSVRLRSYNAIGNPNFEVDQRNCFSGIPNISHGAMLQDRWQFQKTGTYAINTGQAQNSVITIPGSNYVISRAQLGLAVGTPQASLAGGDFCALVQNIEGSVWREILNDVFSISLLVQSNVANQKFSVAIRDSTSANSIVYLCTIPTANVWTLVTIPNIPKPLSGGFPVVPGSVAVSVAVTLACGANFTAPAAGTWQAGNFLAAPGTSNFVSTAANGFYVAFVQLEPGPVCSTPMDKPFFQNLDESLRYYCKSYNYAVKAGTVTGNGAGAIGVLQPFANYGLTPMWTPFSRRMAKGPSVLVYSPVSGVVNAAYNTSSSSDWPALPLSAGEAGFQGISLTSPPGGTSGWQYHYYADTGW